MAPYTANVTASINSPAQGAATYTYIINPTTILNIQAGVVRYYSSGGELFEPPNFQATSWGYTSNLGMTRPPVYWTDEYALIGPDVWAGNVGKSLDAQNIDQIKRLVDQGEGQAYLQVRHGTTFLPINNQAGPGQTTGGFDVDSVGSKAIPSGASPGWHELGRRDGHHAGRLGWERGDGQWPHL